jgi:phosphoenolpyruvate synthase/pyruvate phosphate dikinase
MVESKNKSKKTNWKWEFQRYMDIGKIQAFAQAFFDMAGTAVYISKKGCINFYWDDDHATKISLELIKKAKQDSEFTSFWTKDAEAKCDRWTVFTQEIEKKDLAKVSNQELYAIYEDFFKLHSETASFAVFIRVFVHQGVVTFQEILEKTMVDKSDIPQRLTILTSTPKESFNGEEEQAFFKIALKLLENNEDPTNLSKDALKKLQHHQEKFCWIPCGYFDEDPHTLDYYLHRLRRIAKDKLEAQKACEKIKNLGKELKKEQKRILDRVNLDEETLRLMDCLQECVYYKDFVRGELNKGYYKLYPYFTELGKRLGLSMREVKYLVKDELKDALLNGANYDETIKKRMDFHVLTNEDSKLLVLVGKEAKKCAASIEASQKTTKKQLKGMPACGGYAKARARIVHDPKEIQNETHDFILVASMTTPEFVVALQKCLAIVTDEGGITCHAAIVAREMNKPCIIGTKTATKTFKHGDILEVNAEKGIVRKVGQIQRSGKKSN